MDRQLRLVPVCGGDPGALQNKTSGTTGVFLGCLAFASFVFVLPVLSVATAERR